MAGHTALSDSDIIAAFSIQTGWGTYPHGASWGLSRTGYYAFLEEL